MQNRYTGDIGDFGKFGLLRALAASCLTIGVNWYLTPDEHHNSDGWHVKYLNHERYRSCDESLWYELKRIVDSGKRDTLALQDEHILNATFFSTPLDFTGKTKMERKQFRENWHMQALKKLAGVDLVFIDPDNGLVVPSSVGGVKENKFVKPDELADYYEQGSSVIYYQHKARRPDSFYTEQHNQLIESAGFEKSSGLALKFRTTSQRYYFFILHARHKEAIEGAVNNMLSTAWSDHFCTL